ncbi:DUF2155 domain-containing protein [Rhodopseudomonas boonkerdii]|uniref:DUF2155 domain-containing protein n=1 Tax=Rhodopseudomonas boonkerdii TaxID=475937 RepID=UPI001E63732A|nr:DUF2155 domain-containing protein [Rhodopseudomonas boonkerdii]UGV26917.1 DUF2155 domain-containing protein [Rhodopseudomonas boonkerdii]
MFRTFFVAKFAIAGFAALVAATALSTAPVHAQFGPLFGDPPPRPPGSVPRGQQPPPMDDDEDVPDLPQGRLLPARPAPGMGVPPPGAVQSQPLAPPPGSNVTTIPQNSPGGRPSDQPPPLGVTPSQPQQPGIANVPPPGTPNPNAKQAPKNAPPPAATLQPGDEVVTEPPAQKIPNKKAAFSGLDKITGRIINFDADIGETVQFGALRVKTDACYTRPATEAANTDAFVEVDEITLQGEVRRIFSGWMFAASPGLHGVEHPIYDIWLTDCKQPEVVANQQETRPAPATVQKRQPPRQQPRPQPQQQLLPPPGFPAFRQ